MPFEEYKQTITGARGPNSQFGPNQIVNVPGIGPVRLSDYGPGVRGIDIPVTNRREMGGNAVNRVVNINGQNVQLSGYMPSQYDPNNVDPTGGGSLDAYGRSIIPYGGGQQPQTQSSGNVTDNPFSGGYPAQAAQSSSGETTDNPFAGGYPQSVAENVQSIGGIDIPPANMGNEPTSAPYNAAFEGGSAWNPPTFEGMSPSGSEQYYPSEGSNIPTQEWLQPTGPEQYQSTAPANVPTYEGMSPTGPNDFLPSEGANVPTNESMAPTDPQQYLPSEAGANIPTDESMTADLAPDAFGPSTEPEPTYSYPSGDGSYVTLDSSGNPVGTTPTRNTPSNAGSMSPYDPGFEYGADPTGALSGPNVTSNIGGIGSSTTGNYFQGLGARGGPIAGSFGNFGLGGGGPVNAGALGGASNMPWYYYSPAYKGGRYTGHSTDTPEGAGMIRWTPAQHAMLQAAMRGQASNDGSQSRGTPPTSTQ